MLAQVWAWFGPGLVWPVVVFRWVLYDFELEKRATEVQELINANRQQYSYTAAVERGPCMQRKSVHMCMCKKKKKTLSLENGPENMNGWVYLVQVKVYFLERWKHLNEGKRILAVLAFLKKAMIELAKLIFYYSRKKGKKDIYAKFPNLKQIWIHYINIQN